jgi:FkbM family methyltransferase
MIRFLKKIYRRVRLFWRIFVLKKYGTIDLWFWEKGDDTYRLDYRLNDKSLVLDLGGYKGEWAQKIFHRYQSRIFVFEPVGDFQQVITKKFSANPDISLFPFGLGGNTRTDTIFLNDNGSSTHKNGGQEREEISIVGIAQFFEEHRIEFVDLMKINIEGEEYPLIEAILLNHLHLKIRNIQVQFHPWIEEAPEKRDRIRQELAKTHRLTYDFPFVWENWELIE